MRAVWLASLTVALTLTAAACARGGRDGIPPTARDSGPGFDAASPTDSGTLPVDSTVIGPGCTPSPCDANASCDDSTGTPVCTCNAGFTGDGTTCTDVDECTMGTAPCDTNASCTNTPGGFTCECSAGWEGDGATCTDIDECLARTAGCDTNATCSNMPGGFTCTCDTGWMGDGTTCTDVDECAAGTAGCDANATCTNGVGDFSCACNTGYVGDGFTCTPLCTNVADFETGSWPAPGWTVPDPPVTGFASTGAAHDGTWGFDDQGPAPFSWQYTTTVSVGATGDKLGAWVRSAGDGRFYLGFAASSGGCNTFVIGNNTNEILFQSNSGFSYATRASTSFAPVSGRWYRIEVEFLGGGSVVGRVFDSDGTTLRATLTHDYGSLGTGGVCFRSFNWQADTIENCR